MSMNKITILILALMSISMVSAEVSFLLDAASDSDNTNRLLSTPEDRISMLLPVVFIIVSLVAFMADFGTVGVLIGSIFGLAICVWIGLVMISGFSLLSFMIMGGLLLYKVAS